MNDYSISGEAMDACLNCARNAELAFESINEGLNKIRNDHLPASNEYNNDILGSLTHTDKVTGAVLNSGSSIYSTIADIAKIGYGDLVADEELGKEGKKKGSGWANLGVGLLKFGEGLVQSVENVLDGVGSLVVTVLDVLPGDDTLSNGLLDFISDDTTANMSLFTNAYGFLDQYATMKSDSTAANVIKGVGVGCGYAIMAGIGGAGTMGANALVAGVGGYGHGLTEAHNEGLTGGEMYLAGAKEAAWEAGSEVVFNAGFKALGKAGSKVANALADTKAGKAVIDAVGNAKDAVKNSGVVTAAKSAFDKTGKYVPKHLAKEGASEAAEAAGKTAMKETAGELTEGATKAVAGSTDELVEGVTKGVDVDDVIKEVKGWDEGVKGATKAVTGSTDELAEGVTKGLTGSLDEIVEAGGKQIDDIAADFLKQSDEIVEGLTKGTTTTLKEVASEGAEAASKKGATVALKEAANESAEYVPKHLAKEATEAASKKSATLFGKVAKSLSDTGPSVVLANMAGSALYPVINSNTPGSVAPGSSIVPDTIPDTIPNTTPVPDTIPQDVPAPDGGYNGDGGGGSGGSGSTASKSHILTIYYAYQYDPNTNVYTETRNVNAGDAYNYTPMSVTYYNATPNPITGVMPDSNLDVHVTYMPINDANGNGIADELERQSDVEKEVEDRNSDKDSNTGGTINNYHYGTEDKKTSSITTEDTELETDLEVEEPTEILEIIDEDLIDGMIPEVHPHADPNIVFVDEKPKANIWPAVGIAAGVAGAAVLGKKAYDDMKEEKENEEYVDDDSSYNYDTNSSVNEYVSQDDYYNQYEGNV